MFLSTDFISLSFDTPAAHDTFENESPSSNALFYVHVFEAPLIKIKIIYFSVRSSNTFSAASTVCLRSMEMVTGPTPPGTGVIAEALSRHAS